MLFNQEIASLNLTRIRICLVMNIIIIIAIPDIQGRGGGHVTLDYKILEVIKNISHHTGEGWGSVI
jgi:hypothetical protein